jgi:Invasion associated locus B (IalB) protein
MIRRRLPRLGAHRICPAMRATFVMIALALLFSATVVEAQTHRPAARPAPAAPGPKALGKFEDWTAAVHQESGQTVCYAFTRAQTSVPAVAGRGDVVYTVTERPTGRDAVAISAGFTYPQGADVLVQVDQNGFHFYTSQRNAFARDGGAVVAAMLKGRQMVARSPGPRGARITDTFSLSGFSAAYGAIVKACPAR